MKVTFIGCGNLVQAIIKGLAQSSRPMNEFYFYSPSQLKAKELASRYGGNHLDDLQGHQSEIVVLAFKPQQLQAGMNNAHRVTSNESLVVSLLAAVDLATLKKHISAQAYLRLMTNTSCAYQKGVSTYLSTEQNEKTQYWLDLMKKVSSLYQMQNEQQIDYLTGLNGSGPAFLYYFLQQWINELNTHPLLENISLEQKQSLVLETLASAYASLQAHAEPTQLISQVASSKGVTLAGLEKLSQQLDLNAVMQACYQRIQDLK